MRKILAVLMALGFVGLADMAQASTTNTYTNAIGAVFTVVADAYGARVTSYTTPGVPTSSEADYAELPGIQLDSGGATSTTNTLFTPRGLGDILIGYELSTGAVWIATGATTNDWKAIFNP